MTMLPNQTYVSCHVSKYKRSSFCQLRTGILPLEIETGRYYRTAVSSGDRKDRMRWCLSTF